MFLFLSRLERFGSRGVLSGSLGGADEALADVSQQGSRGLVWGLEVRVWSIWAF